MRKWRVLNLTEIQHRRDSLDPLREVAEITTLSATPENLAAHLPDSDAYLAALKVLVTRDVLERCPRLRVVATSSTGTDHLNLECMGERGVDLICLKNDTDFLSNITCTAEMAWGLLLSVVRRIPWSFGAAKEGIWARDRFRGHQLSGMTLGVLGYGRLGTILAEYGKAFHMRVLTCDVREVEPAEGIEMVDLDTLLRQSDVLSLHIHLTPENTGLIDAAAFAKMKRGAFLLNTSRGAIIDEVAFLEALESGHLGGAGVDVIYGEWDENLKEHPLIKYANTHENLVISPHTGGVTFEAQAMTLEFTANKLANYLRNLGDPDQV